MSDASGTCDDLAGAGRSSGRPPSESAMTSDKPETRWTLRDVIVSFALANLYFIPGWRLLIRPSAELYSADVLPRYVDLAALCFDILIVTALAFAAAAAVRRSERRGVRTAGRVAFVVASVIGVCGLRREIAGAFSAAFGFVTERVRFDAIPEQVAIAIGAGAAVAFGLAAYAARRKARAVARLLAPVPFSRAVAVLLTIAAPIGATLPATAALRIAHYEASGEFARPQLPEAAPVAPGAPPRRVLWMVFDEWDYRLTFEDRPAGVAMPEVDRFRAGAVSATTAVPPTGDTLSSIPAMLTGERVWSAYPEGPSTLRLAIRGRREHASFREMETVFDRARALGAQTAVAGWFHPYSRVVGHSLTRCYWESLASVGVFYPKESHLGTRMLDLFWWSATSLPFVSEPLELKRFVHQRSAVEDHHGILEAGRRVAADPNLQFVFIHWSIPHLPAVIDAETGAPEPGPEDGYADNLVALDRSFGEIRRELERSGLWDTTVVCLTSDHMARWPRWRSRPHWLGPDDLQLVAARSVDWRVPLLVRLPGEVSGRTFERRFEIVETHGLLLAALQGEVTTHDDVVAWLATHSREDPQTQAPPSELEGL